MNSRFKNKYLLIIISLVIILALIGIVYWNFFFNKSNEAPIAEKPLENNQTQQTTTTPSQTSGLKTYRNEEFGFEFQYPENWSFQVNSFYSPFSKFNLQGNSSAENYNPFSPSFIINIVTPDFAERAFYDLKNIALETNIGGARGLKYEYEYEGLSKIAIILPFGQYKMILGADKAYEDIFNKILASFKFLK